MSSPSPFERNAVETSRRMVLSAGDKFLLYHRSGWLSRGYRVSVSVHNLPGALFRPKDARDAHSHRGDILPSANLGLVALHLHNVGKLRGHVLRYVLKASALAISVIRCGALHSLSNLLPPTHGRAKGVSDAYVFSMGVHHLQWFRVSFDELIQRLVILLD